MATQLYELNAAGLGFRECCRQWLSQFRNTGTLKHHRSLQGGEKGESIACHDYDGLGGGMGEVPQRMAVVRQFTQCRCARIHQCSALHLEWFGTRYNNMSWKSAWDLNHQFSFTYQQAEDAEVNLVKKAKDPYTVAPVTPMQETGKMWGYGGRPLDIQANRFWCGGCSGLR